MSEKKGSQRRKPDDDRQVGGAEGRQSARSPLSLDRSGGGGGGRTKQAGNHVPRAGEKGDTAITPLTYFSPARARGGRWEEEEEDGGGLEGEPSKLRRHHLFSPFPSRCHMCRSSCRRPKCVPPSRFPARAAAAAAATNSSVISRYLPPLPPPHTHTHTHTHTLSKTICASPSIRQLFPLSLPPSTFPSSPAVSHQAGEKREGRGGKLQLCLSDNTMYGPAKDYHRRRLSSRRRQREEEVEIRGRERGTSIQPASIPPSLGRPSLPPPPGEARTHNPHPHHCSGAEGEGEGARSQLARTLTTRRAKQKPSSSSGTFPSDASTANSALLPQRYGGKGNKKSHIWGLPPPPPFSLPSILL